jgi:hypothetical protein
MTLINSLIINTTDGVNLKALRLSTRHTNTNPVKQINAIAIVISCYIAYPVQFFCPTNNSKIQFS